MSSKLMFIILSYTVSKLVRFAHFYIYNNFDRSYLTMLSLSNFRTTSSFVC